MFESNVALILARLDPAHLVLDVGGWACPFNRAQWVLDAEPYETRGFYRTFGGAPSQGGDREWVRRETWVQRDICGREPWPFRDKEFDFVVCSHTLEDLRDPLGVCSEIVRVGKAGYIEVPSRIFESTAGVEREHQAGLSHHRWLIEIRESRLLFLPKYHMIHAERRFHLPGSYLRGLPAERSVQWLWWEGGFDFEEVQIHGLEAQEAELERFVRATCPYPPWRRSLDRANRWLGALPGRAIRRAGRLRDDRGA